MARWFDNLSMGLRLAIIAMCTTAGALITAAALMVAIDSRTYEKQKVEELTAEANVVSESVLGAVVFSDANAAHDSLKALAANPEIMAGAAYDANGGLLASYTRDDRAGTALPPKAPARESRISGADVTVGVPVRQGKEVFGTAYLVGHIESAQSRASRQSLLLLAIGIGALCLVLPISARLHRHVTDPISELAKKNAIIETTLASVEHGVLVVDTELRVTFLNERVLRLLRLPPDTLTVGSSLADAARAQPDATENVRAALIRAEVERMQSAQSLRYEYTLPSGDIIEYRQSPLPGGGFVRIYTDVTEERTFQRTLREARARAEEADQAKSQFLAAMSHEIRTPMNGVIGLIDLLQSTPLSDEQRQMIEIVRQSGIGLLDVINDILDYSKIEAGRMTVESTPFALGEVVEATTTAISGHTKSKTLNIACTIDPRIDWNMLGDPVRIRQIILNLMGNALKFTEVGSIEIEAKAEKVTDDQITVLFEVTDTGIGIAEDKITRLFDRFSQADYSTTRRFGGTGLGLSISKNLVELMGGEIGARSTLGEGSTFWFKIPFRRLPEAERRDPFSAYASALSNLRVLVCDRAAHKAAVTVYLRAIGITVLEAKSVSQAVETLSRTDGGRGIDLAVLTVRLGEDTASIFAAELERRRNLEKTKVLLILPNMSVSAARQSTKSKLTSTVAFPLSRSILYNAIASLTEHPVRSAITDSHRLELDFTPPSVDEAVAANSLILVAEDNETNQFVIKRQLSRLGFASEFASDGSEAWEILAADPNRYGLLLTDCHMPFMDGYQLAGMIRKNETGSGRRLPIVALTANALEGESEICIAAGMDDYLSKPVSPADLDKMIRKWLPRAADLRRKANTGVAAMNGGSLDGHSSAAAPEPDPAPVDMAGLAKIIGSDEPKQLWEMLNLFWSTTQDVPNQLHKFQTANNARGIAEAAHSAKGAAATACAHKLAHACKDMEAAGRNEDWASIATLMPVVDRAFEEVGAFISNRRLGA